MQHPDEGTIHAWLDGQLSAVEAAALEAHAAECADCAAVIAEARGLIAASSRIVSALDTMPGGVIPARTVVRRPWYASTQLRAAAAVLFVAGASMLVLQRRDSAPLQEAGNRVPATPKMEVTRETPQAAADVSASLQPVPRSKAEQDSRPSQQPRAERRKASSTAGDTTAPKKAAADASQPVVTGVAALDEPVNDELKLVRADTTGSVKMMVYRVAQGAEVTLTEAIPVPLPTAMGMQRERMLQVGAAAQAKTAPAPPPVTRNNSAKAPPIVSITWTDPAASRTYTLSGPFSRERLEEIRKVIEQKKR